MTCQIVLTRVVFLANLYSVVSGWWQKQDSAIFHILAGLLKRVSSVAGKKSNVEGQADPTYAFKRPC